MKRITFFIVGFFLLQTVTPQNPCLPEGITFTTQEQIDNFQTNYPGCTSIEGNVEIDGSSITNLAGLNVITSVGGYLIMEDNMNLKSLSGLENLTEVGGWCWIWDNDSLSDLSGLNNLGSIGGDLQIDGNESLTGLSGLENLGSIEDGLFIMQNPNLTNLNSLQNLTSVGTEGIMIYLNFSLTSLEGLGNINSESIAYLYLANNANLEYCHIKTICDYLASPGGSFEIYTNGPGCNSPEEVEEACDAQGTEEFHPMEFSIHPNPAVNDKISVDIYNPKLHRLTIFNTFGQMMHVQELRSEKTTIDIGNWAPGIYLAVMYADGKPVGKAKFVIP